MGLETMVRLYFHNIYDFWGGSDLIEMNLGEIDNLAHLCNVQYL